MNKKGFTLIELLIVIAIIGLLATLAIVSLTTAQRKARDVKRVADMKSIQSAMELYYSDHAGYPSPASWADLSSDLSAYITALPTAPNHTNTTSPEAYTVGVNTAAGTDSATQYVVGATLEDGSHQALSQDDDVNYAAGGTDDWTTRNFVVSVGAAVTALDCSAASVYCLSE